MITLKTDVRTSNSIVTQIPEQKSLKIQTKYYDDSFRMNAWNQNSWLSIEEIWKLRMKADPRHIRGFTSWKGLHRFAVIKFVIFECFVYSSRSSLSSFDTINEKHSLSMYDTISLLKELCFSSLQQWRQQGPSQIGDNLFAFSLSTKLPVITYSCNCRSIATKASNSAMIPTAHCRGSSMPPFAGRTVINVATQVDTSKKLVRSKYIQRLKNNKKITLK